MKKIIKILCFTAAIAGISYTADAQRSNRNSGGSSYHGSSGGGGGGFSSYRGGGSSQPRAFQNTSRNSAPARTNTFAGNERSQPSQRFSTYRAPQNMQRNNSGRNNGTSFNQSAQAGRTSTFPRPVGNSGYRGTTSSSVSRTTYNTSINNYHYSSSYYGGGYYNYNHRNYSFMYGPRYTYIPRNSIYLSFGGNPYYYNSGFYYGYYGGFYQPIFPPFGLRISVLPYGYYSFLYGGYPYYYYNGIYYRQYDDQYEVVDAPMGAVVRSMPEGVKPVVINGEKLYELNGTYYKEGVNTRGKVIYTVVGKNGQVNNTDSMDDNANSNTTTPPANNSLNNNNQDNINNNQSSTSLQMGDMVDQLPAGSKPVTINGSSMYVTPDNIYLQEDDNNGNATYKVVGR